MLSVHNDSKILGYLHEISTHLSTKEAREHTYRPAVERLFSSFNDIQAANDQARTEHGATDFVFRKKSNLSVILGYAEAKDIDVILDKTEKTEQLSRYAGYDNLILTNYIDFRFFKNGEKYQTVEIAKLHNGELKLLPENFSNLTDEIQAFFDSKPESIKSGKRLAQIMGGKARRIRNNVDYFLEHAQSERNQELKRMFNMMRELLVHDLTATDFADMYAQSLVYGLFVSRYQDESQDSFTRLEARDLVPKSNPFLQKFFDHIVGPDFDKRLGYIVDELCEVFSVSDVQTLVHKHLKILEDTDDKDPIIHFYEDFLKEYDPVLRKKMGAYYTPTPVVKFIVRNVDKILKEEFGIAKGLSSNEKIDHWVETGQKFQTRNEKTGKLQKTTMTNLRVHRVQVLDPAVGTATFLNETIKHIYTKYFHGQEGCWESYVQEDLLPRLHGFELMMAPYTIAHLKIGMTLRETGIKEFKSRLGVYLTNTLEEGMPAQQDLFSFGLSQAVSEESRLAAEIKSDRPIMVVMGNPPYSVSSNNKSDFIQDLIQDYKKDLNERNIQPLSDDYIKFIRFAENMVEKSGQGIVAMITNNSYLDGLIHRQMRKHLLETFDKIFIVDLHGNSKKKETTLDGGKDENVFDIQQGVSVVIMVKKPLSNSPLATVYHKDVYGRRASKFLALKSEVKFTKLKNDEVNYFFNFHDISQQVEYDKFIKLRTLFVTSSVGIVSGKDNELISTEKHDTIYDEEILYRPFDVRHINYDQDKVQRSRYKVMKQYLKYPNLGINLARYSKEGRPTASLSENILTGKHALTDMTFNFPLYVYYEDGSKIVNFDTAELARLRANLSVSFVPEDVIDYIYAVLYSPEYREIYGELLKIDFPRVPIPKNDGEFIKLKNFGTKLRLLHLMKDKNSDVYKTNYSIAGNNEVEKIEYRDQKVWINETQYFGNVPQLAWNFYFGGYQPAQKWLKDRKGRELTNKDLDHYQKIIKILIETDKIMTEIDEK